MKLCVWLVMIGMVSSTVAVCKSDLHMALTKKDAPAAYRIVDNASENDPILNEKDNEDTPLDTLIMFLDDNGSSRSLARLLVKKGGRGKNVLHNALDDKKFGIAQAIIASVPNNDPILNEQFGDITPLDNLMMEESPSIELVKLLKAKGATGSTYIEEKVKKLLGQESTTSVSQKPVRVEAKTESKPTQVTFEQLDQAVKNNNQKQVKEFLENKQIHVNVQDRSGNTVLHNEIDKQSRNLSKNVTMIKFLIEQGADLNIENNFNATSLDTLVRDIGKEDLIQWIIDQKIAINQATKNNALAVAIEQNLNDIARILIKAGAEFTKETDTGQLFHKALDHQLRNKKPDRDFIKLLIKQGINVAEKDLFSQNTALDKVLQWEDRDLLKMLVDKGVSIRSYDQERLNNVLLTEEERAQKKQQEKPSEMTEEEKLQEELEEYIRANNVKEAEKLLNSQGPDSAKKLIDKYVQPHLFDAIFNGNKEMVKLFVHYKFDGGLKEPNGRTTLDFAIFQAKNDIAMMLYSAGVPYTKARKESADWVKKYKEKSSKSVEDLYRGLQVIARAQ